jgi:hypothetical protein
MASDPRLDPHNILNTRLAADEQLCVIIRGSRLCADFRLSGTVHVSQALGHSIKHAVLGGTWVPGLWAASNRSLHYVSKRSWFGWHGGQAFDVTLPLLSIVDIEPQKTMRGVGYKFFYSGGAVRFWATTSEGDKLVSLLKSALRTASYINVERERL